MHGVSASLNGSQSILDRDTVSGGYIRSAWLNWHANQGTHHGCVVLSSL